LWSGGQKNLHRNKIPHDAIILWIYPSKKTFGDANLELSGRKLLKGKRIALDIVLLPEVYPLFQEDDIFTNVFYDMSKIDQSKYTHIILTEYNYKSIELKIKHFKKLPYSCLFGYFDGPARNQFHFSYFAINDFFSLNLIPEDIIKLARPYISSHSVLPDLLAQVTHIPNLLAIGIGGIDPGKTYNHWPEFLIKFDELSLSL
jgi:heptosyltransferase-2